MIGYSTPPPGERRHMFPCEFWLCRCGYGEHAAPRESRMGMVDLCPHCNEQLMWVERHWHRRGS